jgi:DNA-binding NarL/FixJ family response regulator
LGPDISEALINKSKSSTKILGKVPSLSSREQQVLELMATPATYREIGDQLFIGEETVRTYVKRILTKLDQANRTQAVIAVIKLGLIQLD